MVHMEDTRLNACDFSPDGLRFVVAGEDRRIHVYDEITRQNVCSMYSNGQKLPGHQLYVFATKFVPYDGNLVLTGGWDRIIKIYDLRCQYPVDQIIGPQISGDALDIADDTILAGSNRQEKPISLFSFSMRKKITDIELENQHSREKVAGFVYGARFSKDRESTCFFACGAGRNEAKVFDNDTEGSGRYREMSSFGSNLDPYLSCDTSPNGRLVAFGTHTGYIYISSYDTGVDEDDGKNKGPVRKQTTLTVGNTAAFSHGVSNVSASAAAAATQAINEAPEDGKM